MPNKKKSVVTTEPINYDLPEKADAVEGEILNSKVEVEEDSDVDYFSEDEEYKETVWGVLEQAGITKGRLIGFVLFVCGLLFLLFVFVFRGGDDSGNDQGVVDNTIITERDDSAPYLEVPYIVGNAGRVEIVGMPIADFVSGGTIAVDLAFALGRNVSMEGMVQYARYLKLVELVQNVYDTDVYDYLDSSVDRIEALNKYVAEMEFLIDEVKVAAADVDAILTNIERQYGNLVAEQSRQEGLFFQAVDSLSGIEADERLSAFITLGQEVVEIRAVHNAYKELAKMFDNVLFYMEPRLRDVELNRDLLLDGNRVVPVDNSDIGTIIYR
ncbi:hypothetical protein CVV38_03855 [Candidatus Peregrinibacteria bacterium HGW-Peregrinibacteria-1]|jgi:hypothetical protein|nr:MAG: hypothetical protein CVV38_03855 [Candidatus Peregrinibacteria bacterium HGW-Peregrinibacteria-1]